MGTESIKSVMGGNEHIPKGSRWYICPICNHILDTTIFNICSGCNLTWCE